MILPILTAPRYLLTFNPAFKSGKNRGGEKGEGKMRKVAGGDAEWQEGGYFPPFSPPPAPTPNPPNK